MEQKHPSDIFDEALTYLWVRLKLEEKGWKRLKKGDFKKRMKNGLTYIIEFTGRRYNYLDHETGEGSIEVNITFTICMGDDVLFYFRINDPTGWFQLLTVELQLNRKLLDSFIPLIQTNYLDFIDHFEDTPHEALQTICKPVTQPDDYSWIIRVDERMIENYGTQEQMEEYRRQKDLFETPESKVRQWMGMQIFYLSRGGDVNHAWAASRTIEELDAVVGKHVRAKKEYGLWTEMDEAGYQLYLQEQDVEKRTYRAWYLIGNPRNLPKEIVNQELDFRSKLFRESKEQP